MWMHGFKLCQRIIFVHGTDTLEIENSCIKTGDGDRQIDQTDFNVAIRHPSRDLPRRMHLDFNLNVRMLLLK